MPSQSKTYYTTPSTGLRYISCDICGTQSLSLITVTTKNLDGHIIFYPGLFFD